MKRFALIAVSFIFAVVMVLPAQSPPNYNSEIQKRIAYWDLADPAKPQFKTGSFQDARQANLTAEIQRAMDTARTELRRRNEQVASLEKLVEGLVAAQQPDPLKLDPKNGDAKQPDKNGAPRPFKTGAIRTPVHKILAALKANTISIHAASPQAPPAQVLWVPSVSQLLMWGNDTFGDCVTAEGCFAHLAYSATVGATPIVIPNANAIDWARRHGYLNGADLLSVMQSMQTDGLVDSNRKAWTCGVPSSVDYTNENTLKSALVIGPVKIAIDASALPSGAGNVNGWYSLNGRQFNNTDHCVSIAGYGTAKALCDKLGVAVPAGLDPNKQMYLIFTWSTIGLADFAWLQATCVEAWVRTPTVVGLAPPPQPPTPGPAGSAVTVAYPAGSTVRDDGKGTIVITVPSPNPTPPAGSMTLIVGEGVQPGTYTFTPAKGK